MARKSREKTYVPDSKPCNLPDHIRCIGTNRDGTRCRSSRINDTTVCGRHGGKGGRPPTHGKYSKRGQALREKIERAELDLSLFDQQRRAAVLQALFLDSVEQMLEAKETDSAELWSAAQAAFHSVEVSIGRKDINVLKVALSSLKTILFNGKKAEQAEEKVKEYADRLARISKVQITGAKVAADMMSAKELQLYEACLIRELLDLDLDESTKLRVAGAIDRATRTAVSRSALGQGNS